MEPIKLIALDLDGTLFNEQGQISEKNKNNWRRIITVEYSAYCTREEKGTYGSNGNYVVDSIRPQNIAMAIYFKKIDK